MRIALLSTEYPGHGVAFGVGRYVRDLHALYAEAGHDTLALVVNEAGGRAMDRPGAPRGFGPFAVLWPLRARAWLAEQLAAFVPDVVEAPNWGGLLALLPARHPSAVRISTGRVQLPAPSLATGWVRPLHRRWERLSVSRADLVIANSRASSEPLLRLYGRSADRVVHHAIEAPVCRPRPEARGVLYVGRLEHRKGVDRLVEAWAGLGPSRGDAELHLVGPDPGGFGRQAVARRGAAGVVLHGRLEDAALEAVRARCSLQVVPSRTESFGLGVLEAWAAGLAVVVADIPALVEVAGEAALVAPDVPALVDALRRLLADADLRAALARAGQDRLQTCFGRERWLRENLEAYEETRRRFAARTGRLADAVSG